MSLGWRVQATILAVAGFAGVVTVKFGLRPAPASAWVSLGACLIAALTPLAVHWWLTRRMRGTATFELSAAGPGFVAPGSLVSSGFLAVAILPQVANVLPYEGVPGTDRIRLPTDPGLLALAGVCVLIAVLAVALLWLPAAELRLTPDGITVRRAFRSRTIRWEDLLPGGPHPATQWRMRLLHRDAAGDQQRCTVPIFRLRVDPVFAATVIRHYAEHGEHRAAIGTQHELDRLQGAYAAWRAAPTPGLSTARA